MSLKDELFETLNSHMKEKSGEEKPTVEQILEMVIKVNEFNSEWIDEANDFIKERS